MSDGHIPTLWLARHAQVQAEGGLCYGATDLPADAAATREAARALAQQLPPGLPMSTSPLQRCRLLARQVQTLRADLTCQADVRLREMDFGGWEGRRWSDIARAEFDRWLSDFADTPPSVGGETVRAFMARVGAAWDDWRASGSDAVWIAHAGVARAALLLAGGVRVPAGAEQWPRAEISPGSVLCLRAR